ncbi:AAA family ATPase [Actinomadura keratinilytica]|uniref:AAA family ATPase n=1 Tax=Actinomadura keratinilytica TaxID=547461 RepID=UPI0036062E68
MTTRFRINSVALDTTEGEVRYEFPSELTVLAGDTGVGKTTLLELIKFGFGGDAVLADVAVNHVNSVTLDVLIGDAHLKLSRSLAKTERRIARVTDLINQERLPDHRIGRASSASGAPSLNSLLMASLGLPDDMRAAARTKGNTRAGNRITFADVFLFLYVPQSAINQQIAHSEESYREPKRKTVFELLFDITDPDTLALQSKVNELNAKIVEAEKEHQTVLDFLRTTGTAGREETEQAYAQAVAEQEAARTEQAALRQNLEPIADHETRALRDLLDRAEADLAEARSTITELVRQQDEYRAERRRVQTDIDRLQRMQDAGQRLTQIEFTTCPRCMQPLTGRDVPAGHCRVCLQPDPVTTSEVAHLTDQYEFKQLTEQLVEMDDHLNAIAQQLSAIMRAATEREQLVRELTAKIDARTAERIPHDCRYSATQPSGWPPPRPGSSTWSKHCGSGIASKTFAAASKNSTRKEKGCSTKSSRRSKRRDPGAPRFSKRSMRSSRRPSPPWAFPQCELRGSTRTITCRSSMDGDTPNSAALEEASPPPPRSPTGCLC